MSKPKFNLGDEVWFAHTTTRPVYIQCEECMGKRYLTVILGDDSRVTIGCECCRRGYLGSQGAHEAYEHFEEVSQMTVAGVEESEGTFEYQLRVNGCPSWASKESSVFATEEEALARATELAHERTEAARKVPCQKVKHDRSWAWHVLYHRDAIRRAEKDIKQHREALDYASSVAREAKCG